LGYALICKVGFIIVSRCIKEDETAEEVQGTMKSILWTLKESDTTTQIRKVKMRRKD
jgi:hypothetical protein